MLTILTISMVLFAWLMWCNMNAYNKRSDIIRKIYLHYISEIGKTDPLKALWDDYSSVSYERHFWYLVFFLNPMKLYPPSIRKLVNTP